ncbi:hypothetical protein GSI_05004 [Ganoderma sinense ZZ0214-1]|uniref:F-box domain-containing protein n=1 Tax=Ganoderma sinense ZZ0214-1 TaxID=1077348 RepID=A0A2G8SGJ6_9APHY|nr:hypothetical protein GSI_05004 [Ganoderma sinense ZZ0214-1]
MPATSYDATPWTLRFDAITGIMNASSPADVASLMGTCRFLYNQGAKHLLRRGVTLRTPRQIASFALFMSAEDTTRFRHLRELSLEVGSLDCRALVHNERSVAMDALLEVLQCPALCLHTLRLERAEELLSSSHAIRVAFRALATLKHLTICDVGPATVSTVAKMSSKLVSVTVCNVDPALDLMASSDQVIEMLAPFSDTLEEVSLVLDGPCNFAQTPLDICFPLVRRLTILSDSCRFLPSCVHFFPNVEVIQHNPSPEPQHSIICLSTIDSFVDCVTAARKWNTGCLLSALTECSSDLITLCVLRPALVPLRKLRISTQVHDPAALMLITDVLIVSQPDELEMCVAGLDTLDGVLSLLVERALDALCTLRINFSFAPGAHNGHASELCAALARLTALVDGFPAEVPSFDLILDLVSCFGQGAVHLEDEDVRAFRDCLSSYERVQVPAPYSRRIIPIRPVYVGEDEDLVGSDTDTVRADCGKFEDDFDAWSDKSEWGYSDSEPGVEDPDEHWLLPEQNQEEVEEDASAIYKSFVDVI